MRMFRMPTVALFVIYFLMANMVGCGGGGVSGGGSNVAPSAQAAATKAAVTATGCGSAPCLLPSQTQAEALFVIVEQMLPEYCSNASLTQTLQSGNDTIYYREYTNQYGVTLATYVGHLFYAVNGEWYLYGTLDEANQFLCGNNCWSSITSLEQALTAFNTSVDDMSMAMVSLNDVLGKLNTALASDNGSAVKTAEIGTLVDALKLSSTAFLINIEKMDHAETEIEKRTGTKAAVSKSILFPLVGAALIVAGLYSFGKKMKEYSDSMSTDRNKRDEAATGVMNSKPGSTEAFSSAKKNMKNTGEAAIQELGTKVTTDLILSPVNPTTITGLIIKEAAGNALQTGLKVISSTKECANGYSSAGCKLGVSSTKANKPAIVPSGKTDVVVGGKNISRTVIAEKEFAPGKTVEITRAQTPVTQATPTSIVNNDSNTSNPVVSPSLTLSMAKTSEDSTSITYTVAAALTSVTAPTSVTISLQNAATGSSTKSISSNSTVSWSVTVLQQDAHATVTRNDTGVLQTLTLPGKTGGVTANSYGSCTKTFTLGKITTRDCSNYTGKIYQDPAQVEASQNLCANMGSQWSAAACPAGAIARCSYDYSGSQYFDGSYQIYYYGDYSLPGSGSLNTVTLLPDACSGKWTTF